MAEFEQEAMNLGECAKYLGRSANFVRNLVDAQLIPCVVISNGGDDSKKSYLFSRKAVDAWLTGKDETGK